MNESEWLGVGEKVVTLLAGPVGIFLGFWLKRRSDGAARLDERSAGEAIRVEERLVAAEKEKVERDRARSERLRQVFRSVREDRYPAYVSGVEIATQEREHDAELRRRLRSAMSDVEVLHDVQLRERLEELLEFGAIGNEVLPSEAQVYWLTGEIGVRLLAAHERGDDADEQTLDDLKRVNRPRFGAASF